MVHSDSELKKVINASNILFSKDKELSFSSIDEETFLEVFEGVPNNLISKEDFKNCSTVEELIMFSSLFNSKSDLSRALKENYQN